MLNLTKFVWIGSGELETEDGILYVGSLGQDKCEYNMPFLMLTCRKTGEFIREATDEERDFFYNKKPY